MEWSVMKEIDDKWFFEFPSEMVECECTYCECMKYEKCANVEYKTQMRLGEPFGLYMHEGDILFF